MEKLGNLIYCCGIGCEEYVHFGVSPSCLMATCHFLGAGSSFTLQNCLFIQVKRHVSLYEWIFLRLKLVSFLGFEPKKSDTASETCVDTKRTIRSKPFLFGRFREQKALLLLRNCRAVYSQIFSFPPIYSPFSAWHVWISRFLAPFLSSFFPSLPTRSSSPFCLHSRSSALSPSLPFPRPSHNTFCLPYMRLNNGRLSFSFQFLTLRLLDISLHVSRG